MSADEEEQIEFVVPASSLLSEGLRSRAVEEFGEESAWLLLSQLVYGWRAYFDLGAAVAAAERPVEAGDSRPTAPDVEFQIVKDLQVQGLLYSAAEQLAGTILAARAHASGSSTFLEAYSADRRVAQLMQEADELSRSRAFLTNAQASSAPLDLTIRHRANLTMVGLNPDHSTATGTSRRAQ